MLAGKLECYYALSGSPFPYKSCLRVRSSMKAEPCKEPIIALSSLSAVEIRRHLRLDSSCSQSAVRIYSRTPRQRISAVLNSLFNEVNFLSSFSFFI